MIGLVMLSYMRPPQSGIESDAATRIIQALPPADVAVTAIRQITSPAVPGSDATFEQAEMAHRAGYRHMTHLYSAMSGVKRVRGRRIAGAIEAGLAIDGLTVEMIADGMHLPPGLLRLILKCKGADRIALVTDAMRAAGMPEGEYLLGSGGEGQRVIVDEGVAWLPDRSAFAGSVALGIRLVGNMVNLAGAGIVEAVRMMSLNPAKMIGLEGSIGSIAEGKLADITLFDDEFRISDTFVVGEAVYRI